MKQPVENWHDVCAFRVRRTGLKFRRYGVSSIHSVLHHDLHQEALNELCNVNLIRMPSILLELKTP